jgi:hypothetical protein
MDGIYCSESEAEENRARKHIWCSVFDPPVAGLLSSGFVCSSVAVGNDITDTVSIGTCSAFGSYVFSSICCISCKLSVVINSNTFKKN